MSRIEEFKYFWKNYIFVVFLQIEIPGKEITSVKTERNPGFLLSEENTIYIIQV